MTIVDEILSLSDIPILTAKIQLGDVVHRLSPEYTQEDLNRFKDGLRFEAQYKGIIFYLDGTVYIKNSLTKYTWVLW